jgi:hypothetical protein
MDVVRARCTSLQRDAPVSHIQPVLPLHVSGAAECPLSEQAEQAGRGGFRASVFSETFHRCSEDRGQLAFSVPFKLTDSVFWRIDP